MPKRQQQEGYATLGFDLVGTVAISIRGPSPGPLRQHAEVTLVVDVEVAVAPQRLMVYELSASFFVQANASVIPELRGPPQAW